MTVLEQLKAGRAKIERGWCQHDLAQDGVGRGVNPLSSEAVAWCAFGAIDNEEGGFSLADEALIAAHGHQFIGDWNDEPSRAKADVLALFDKAIASEEAKAP